MKSQLPTQKSNCREEPENLYQENSFFHEKIKDIAHGFPNFGCIALVIDSEAK